MADKKSKADAESSTEEAKLEAPVHDPKADVTEDSVAAEGTDPVAEIAAEDAETTEEGADRFDAEGAYDGEDTAADFDSIAAAEDADKLSDDAFRDEAEPVLESTGTPEPGPMPAAPPPPTQPAARRGGFASGFLGGVIGAALVGVFGYLYLFQSSGLDQERLGQLSDAQASQADAIADLRDQVAAGPDMSAVTSRIDEVTGSIDDLSGRIDVAMGDISAIQDRITEIEKRPVAESVSEEAIAAYEDELERLRQAMERQREEVEALIEEARQVESDANATAEATMRRAALTRILSALDTGAPYAAALSELEAAGQEIPEALAAAAETGVPSMSELRETFPDSARRALAAAPRSGTGSIGDFLRDQLGARSLEPREGDDADAILSRAEAALKTGRLGDALAEIAALPDESRAEMAGWVQDAEIRRDAVAAAEDLSAALNAG